MDKSSLIQELESLFKLLEKGAISIDEYEAQKKALLASENNKEDNIGAEKSQSIQPDPLEETGEVEIVDYTTDQNHLSPKQPRQTLLTTPIQPIQPERNQSNSISVKIIFIMVVGVIILFAMFFIFISGNQFNKSTTQSSVSYASMASSVITAQEQQAASKTASEAKNENVEEVDTDETGLNLNKRTPEELNKMLVKYQQERSKAEAKLRKVWAELDPDFKRSILDEQKNWDNTALMENCSLTGYKTIEAQQVAKLYCESNFLYSRADILLAQQRDNLAEIKDQLVEDNEKLSVDALQRLELSWTTLPENVQKNLNQTYSEWYEESKQYCLSRPTGENIYQTKIKFNQCITEKAENKIKEINGFKI